MSASKEIANQSAAILSDDDDDDDEDDEDDEDEDDDAGKKSRMDAETGKVCRTRKQTSLTTLSIEEFVSVVKSWKFSGYLFVLIFVLCPSSAHCVPGSDWQMTGSTPREDVGANSYTTAYLNVTYTDPGTNQVRTEKSEIGKFGDGRVGPASGVLVHVSSWEGGFTGCAAPLRSSYGNGSLPQEPWIALVKRGQCNFEVKVENALRHNASAILVYNDRESPTLDKMKLTATRNMSAVFTYKWKGEQLARLVDNGSRIVVHITVATHCTRPNAHVNRTSVLFVSISFVVLMLTSLAWLIFYYVQRFRYLHAKDKLSRRLCDAAKRALSRIPTKEIQQEDREVQGDGECCAVCIEPYKVTDDLRVLPCRHEFHKCCIDPWLLEHRTCPMCKMNILRHYGFAITNTRESILQENPERGEREREAETTGAVHINEPQGLMNAGNPSNAPNQATESANLDVISRERDRVQFQSESVIDEEGKKKKVVKENEKEKEEKQQEYEKQRRGRQVVVVVAAVEVAKDHDGLRNECSSKANDVRDTREDFRRGGPT